MGKCPFCSHKWTYKQKLFGYSLKPRTRIKCPRCREYIEPSTMTIIYDYIAIIAIALVVFLFIPVMQMAVWASIMMSAGLLVIYLAVFLPFTVRFKRYDYD